MLFERLIWLLITFNLGDASNEMEYPECLMVNTDCHERGQQENILFTTNVESGADCDKLCQNRKDCNYWTFDGEYDVCHLLNQCDSVKHSEEKISSHPGCLDNMVFNQSGQVRASNPKCYGKKPYTDLVELDWHCCKPTDKCGEGGGDCDSDNDCEVGLVCQNGWSRYYGFEKSFWWGYGDVCAKPYGIRLHEGDAGTQDVVCDLYSTFPHKKNFKTNFGRPNVWYGEKKCDNDEARSLTLYHASKNTKITLFDDPEGRPGKDDEFTIEVWGEDLKHKVLIPTFDLTSNLFNVEKERSLNISNLAYDRKKIEIKTIITLTQRLKPGSTDTNGLNGKVSHIDIETTEFENREESGDESTFEKKFQEHQWDECEKSKTCLRVYRVGYGVKHAAVGAGKIITWGSVTLLTLLKILAMLE